MTSVAPRWQLLRTRPDDVFERDAAHRVDGSGESDEPAEWVVCVGCGHRITGTDQRASLQGHWHRRTNPAGVTFDIALYHQAPGCRGVGSPTTAHSWFPGFAWSFAMCGGCDGHLGWCFEGEAAASFWGLIVDRIRTSRPV